MLIPAKLDVLISILDLHRVASLFMTTTQPWSKASENLHVQALFLSRPEMSFS